MLLLLFLIVTGSACATEVNRTREEWVSSVQVKDWRQVLEEMEQFIEENAQIIEQTPTDAEIESESPIEGEEILPGSLTAEINKADEAHTRQQVNIAAGVLSDVYFGLITPGTDQSAVVKHNWAKARKYYAYAERGYAYRQEAFIMQYGSFFGDKVETSNAIPKTLTKLWMSAKHGNTDAQIAMGYRHYYGKSVPKDCQAAAQHYIKAASKIVEDINENGLKFTSDFVRLSEAWKKSRDDLTRESGIIDLYKYSADTGDIESQVTIGLFYMHGGHGIARDYERAHKYFLMAQEQGHNVAKSHRAHMVLNGLGIEQDNETGLAMLTEVAEEGIATGQAYLGRIYMNGGHGVEKDVKQAIVWLKKAAEKNSADALFDLGTLYFDGNDIKKDYGSALLYFQRSATNGNVEALYRMGYMHYMGFGTIKNCENGVQVLKKVIEKGYTRHIIQKAYGYYREGNIDKAKLYYVQAGDLGTELALSNAAWLFEQANHGKNYEAAMYFYRNAAQLKSATAHVKMGDYHYYGHGVPHVDKERAAEYYQAASDLRSPQATFNLGFMHEYGIGLPHDFHLAKRYYDMALEISEDAYLPVSIALSALNIHFWTNKYKNGVFGLQWDTLAIIILLVLLTLTLAIRRVVSRV